MNKELIPYFCIAEAISLLLHPYGEVVIHDLKTDRIAALFNNLSKRKIGDESLLEDLPRKKNIPDLFPPYFKTNWDGKKMKCVSATLKNRNQKPIGLLCINLDLSKWEEMQQFILDWIQPKISTALPDILFQDDWREKINLYVSHFVKNEGVSLKNLSREKKRDLIHALHEEGAFEAKNAAAYIGEVLNISRATIYNYLRNAP